MIWLCLVLVLIICALGRLYILAIKQANASINFLLLILLNKENYQLHKDGVGFLVSTTKSDNAIDLALKVQMMVRKLISDNDGNKLFASITSLLWDLKKSIPLGAANNPSKSG